MKANIVVLRDFLAVQEVKETDSPSSVIQVVRNDQRIKKAKVVAIGTGVLTASGTKHPLECKVGDLVVFDHQAGREITHKGEKFLVINELSIFAILPE